ncbi:tRNA-specific adenosine deaminase [Synergistales bacterium]|nr:tRNA-specific adenosine deaminase [Synergistales bacterium]
MDDIFFMRMALGEARHALDRGEIPVGAVVVKGGEVIGRGSNERLIGSLPFAHAEMRAISEAAGFLGSWRLDGASLYVTLEPCPMCAGAIVQTRVARLIYGARDPKAGAAGSLYDIPRDPRMAHNCEVKSGVLADECAELLRNFFAAKRGKDRLI